MENRVRENRIHRLEQELLVLREENDALTRRAEDIFLLGTVSERVELEQTQRGVVAETLESVSTLKDLSYCAFISVDRAGLKVSVIEDFCPVPATSCEAKTFPIEPGLAGEIDEGETFFTCHEGTGVPAFIPHGLNTLKPNSFCIIPVDPQSVWEGIFLYVNYIEDSGYLEEFLPLLSRVTDVVRKRLETLALLEEVRDLNRTLEARVAERTAQLSRSNRRLAAEIASGKQKEEELRQFRGLINRINDILFVIEPETGRILDVNYIGCKKLGYRRGELLDHGLAAVDCAPLSWEKRGKEIRRKRSLLYETYYKTREGSRFPVSVSLRFTRRQGREYLVAVARDISDSRLKELHLRKMNRALMTLSRAGDALVKNTDETVLLQDICDILIQVGGYRFVWVGLPETGEGTRFRAAAKKGKGFEKGYLDNMAMSMDQPDFERGPLGRALRAGKTQVARDIMTAACYKPWREQAMKRGFASMIAIPLKTETGVIGGISIYAGTPDAFDPGEVELLEKLANDLSFGISHLRTLAERKEEEGKRKLLEAQLRQAQKMETLGTLAGGIAHDFNNILTPILGYTEMAMRKLTSDHLVYAHLHQVLEAGRRARNLVRQILTFSRQSEQERKPLEVAPVVEEAMKLLRAMLPATIQINCSIAPGCGTVVADPTQVHQVLMNLCTNAYHAMKEQGGVLEVKVENVRVDAHFAGGYLNLNEGNYLGIFVRDTGTGMDRETRERIFEPFFTTKGVGAGTGLGLAVVHGIVLSHGGEISVHSVPGEGTVFSVYFPQTRAVGIQQKEIMECASLRMGNESILFVDDDPGITDLGAKMLEELGYRVTAFIQSPRALARFREDPGGYDLVITDYTMPELIGPGLAKEIKEARPDIPIILTSGTSVTFTPGKTHIPGIDAYVMKPFTVHDLSRAIRKVLKEA